MKRLYNFLLALSPILSGYGLSLSLDFGSILLFALGVGASIRYPRTLRITMPVGYGLFFVVSLLLSLIWAKSIPLRLLLFSVNLCFACCYAEKESLWKYYSIIVWISVIFFLVQEASFFILGIRPSGLVSFLPTVYGDSYAGIIEETTTSGRSSSFFLEPSFFAQFLVPYVAISLFSSMKEEHKKAIIVSVILLLIRSGVGILLLGIIWLTWFLYSNIKLSTRLTVILIIMSAIGVLLYLNSGLSEYFLGRSSELLSYNGDEQYQSSGFIRIFRGYFVFADLSPMNKLLGTHPTDVQAIFDRSTFLGSESTNYINGMQTLLFYHGIIGTFFFLRHLLLFPYKTKNKTLLVLSIAILFLLLVESFYLSSRLFVMTVFMYLIRKESLKKRFEIRRKKQIL